MSSKENLSISNSIFYDTKEPPVTQATFKKRKIKFIFKNKLSEKSKQKQEDTKIQIGCPQLQQTTYEHIQKLVEITPNNYLATDKLSDEYNKDNINSNIKQDLKPAGIDQNIPIINKTKIISKDIDQHENRNKLLQDIRSFDHNKTLNKVRETKKENNTDLDLVLKKAITSRRQFIVSEVINESDY